MVYNARGVRFVLTAPDTESTENAFSPWKQMVYASVPARFAPRFVYKKNFQQELYPDGTARIMPYGLRIIEDILLRYYPREDVAVCYPEQLPLFVGPRTRAVGVSVHNPVGAAFSTGVYSNIFGSSARPINAYETERVLLHPVLKKYQPKVIVGGAGSWQIDRTENLHRLRVDCLVIGRGESVILDLFQRADDGQDLPRVVRAPEPTIDEIVVPKKRSTYGIVEMTRGCGRQCAFCSPTLETRISLPADELVEAVRANAREGGRVSFPSSEDIFLYGAGTPFYIPNADAIINFYERIAAVPGIEYLPLSHATLAPALVNPLLIKELSEILLSKSTLKNPASTHPQKTFLAPLIGIETGSTSIARRYMAGKSLPFDIDDWQEVVVEGTTILNKNNWFPVYTFIVGLPDETEDDIKQTLDLLNRLRKHKIFYVPSIFTPLSETRIAAGKPLKSRELSKLQWEFILTAWKQSYDFSVVSRRADLAWRVGMRAFYYLRGRWIHGPQFKYPAFRFAGVPEEKISKYLYLDWSKDNDSPEIPIHQPRLIEKHRNQTPAELTKERSL